MPIFQVVVLALVQALTEFLPISSTAHLFLFPWLFGWGDPGLTFTMVVHVGTLFAVLLYFLQTWLTLGLSGIGIRYPRNISDADFGVHRRLFWYLVAATIPAAVIGALLESAIETKFRSAALMGAMLILVGLLMWWAESRANLTRTIESLNFADAMTIGTAQAIALVPGVSRSGITITAGIFKGLTREASARFTFLLSTPIIAGAAAKKIWDLRHVTIAQHEIAGLWIGAIVSGVAGYLVIAFFMRYLQTRTLKIFIYYRIVFGIIILLLAFLHKG